MGVLLIVTLYFAADMLVVEMAKVTCWIRRTATVASLIQIAIMHVIARGVRVGPTAHSARPRMGRHHQIISNDASIAVSCNNGQYGLLHK
jgi:hypothetical protein